MEATQPIERLSLDSKWLVASINANKYLLIVVDEFSRFPLAFPCKDMTSSTIIHSVDKLFALSGAPSCLYSYNGPAIISQKFKHCLLSRGITSSNSSTCTLQEIDKQKKILELFGKRCSLHFKHDSCPCQAMKLN